MQASLSTVSAQNEALQFELNHYRSLDSCDSEPERVLLKALVEKFELSSSQVCTYSGEIALSLQSSIENHRVDFLINDKVVIEVDGKAYHSNDQSFYKDRIRDQKLSVLGYQVIRFPAQQVYEDMEGVLSVIESLIGRA